MPLDLACGFCGRRPTRTLRRRTLGGRIWISAKHRREKTFASGFENRRRINLRFADAEAAGASTARDAALHFYVQSTCRFVNELDIKSTKSRMGFGDGVINAVRGFNNRALPQIALLERGSVAQFVKC